VIWYPLMWFHSMCVIVFQTTGALYIHPYSIVCVCLELCHLDSDEANWRIM